jgi:hypothetical protein
MKVYDWLSCQVTVFSVPYSVSCLVDIVASFHGQETIKRSRPTIE